MTNKTASNTGLAKVAFQCSASTFMVKIATSAKPGTVSGKCKDQTSKQFQQNLNR